MSDADRPGEDVGYRRPPRQHRFKKGQSGNRKGRPRRKTNFEVGANMDPEIANLILSEAARSVSVRENGRAEDISVKQALLRRLNHAALQGDLRSQVEALKLILAAERLFADQKAGPSACPHCSKMAEMSDDELVEELMELLSTGKFKAPAGVELVVLDDADDDPWGVG